jgi:hypothetical protein
MEIFKETISPNVSFHLFRLPLILLRVHSHADVEIILVTTENTVVFQLYIFINTDLISQ